VKFGWHSAQLSVFPSTHFLQFDKGHSGVVGVVVLVVVVFVYPPGFVLLVLGSVTADLVQSVRVLIISPFAFLVSVVVKSNPDKQVLHYEGNPVLHS